MRKFWYRLREIYWSAVIALLVALAGVALAVLGYDSIALAVVGVGITLAILSVRE